jgi:sterol desaturase/sphingolipid hydroxylase (fatty acid hydroxylase superfamily)
MEHLNFLGEIARTFSNVFASDLLRYVIGAGGVYLLINCALAARLHALKIRDASPPAGQIGRELLASLRTVIVFAAHGTLIAFGAETGVFTIYREIAEFGWMYFAFSLAVLIIAHDAWFFWTHKLLHYPPLFRRFHRLHHRSHNPTPFTSYSFDLGEAIVNAVYLPLILLVLPAHPVALFLFVAHMMLRNALGHSGYEVFPADAAGKPLIGWMTTVTHHDLHHAHAGYNLGLYFSWWDKWMGTEHPEYHQKFARVARRVTWSGAKPFLLAVAILVALGTSQGRSEGLSGTYVAEGFGMIVRFEACENHPEHRCGRMVWTWDASDTPYAKAGEVILTGLTTTGSVWVGRLRNPKDGRHYKGTVRRLNAQSLQLKGCAGPICRTQIWHSSNTLRRVLNTLN